MAELEVRSIDYVPLSERHGQLWHLGPLWFRRKAQIARLAAGVVLGAFFRPFPPARGPQLGLPQMIQSRPQFGYVGALLVWLFAYLQYAGFNIFNTILAVNALHTPVHGSSKLFIIVSTVLAAVIALVGYALFPHVERWLTLGFLVI